MKQLLTFLTLFIVIFQVQAQDCTPDQTFADSAIGVYPPPSTMSNPDLGINVDACINEPYEFVFTFVVPETFTIGGPPITLDSVVVDASDSASVSGLPKGLNWSCNPPNCSFDPINDPIACLVINGTPTDENMPGDYSLKINATFFNALTPLTLDLPNPLLNDPDGVYVITLKPQGECTTSTQEQFDINFSMKAMPNPFSYFTQLQVQSTVNEDVNFMVTDLLGNRVHWQEIQLVQGQNTIDFDGSRLANGIYLFTLSNEYGRKTQKMIVNR
ncbi:MAG: T9SS type A sorting domain-containing protein [Bacteroidota bacterium]